ncbi:hypothetical protein D3C73_1369780 [compost metagenome]
MYPEYKPCLCIGQYYDLHKPIQRFVDMNVGCPFRQRFDADLHPEGAQQVADPAVSEITRKIPREDETIPTKQI